MRRAQLTALLRAAGLAVVGVLISWQTASAAPPKPPPGFGKYVMVLKEPEALPPGQAKPNPGKKIVEPDVAKLGGQVVQSRDNERVIFLPPGKAKQLRADENVAYLQRVWLGEPLSEIEAAEEPATGPRLTTNAETNLSWDSGAYEYDGSGNIKQIGSDTYRYDAAGRLTTAVVNTTTVTYNYDSFGNLTSTQVGSQPAAVTPVDKTSNRLSQAEYDAAGNVTTNGRHTSYYYDALNMMSGVNTEIGQQKRMIYTADDERIGVYVDSLSHWTFRGLDGKVLTHFHGDDWTWVWDQDFVYANGQLVAGAREEAFGGRRHYHLDHLGSVRLISDQSRMRIGRHDYYPFGVEQTSMSQEETNWGYVRPDPMKFAGHQRDFLGYWNSDNTDYLDYMHARYYNPNQGRFLSVDPAREIQKIMYEPQLWNRYSYVGNNPMRFTDPDGRERLAYWHFNRQPVPDRGFKTEMIETSKTAAWFGGVLVGPALAAEGAFEVSLLMMRNPGTVLAAMKLLDSLGGNSSGHINPTGLTGGKIGYLRGEVASVESAGKGGFFVGVLGFTAKALDAAIRSHFAANFEKNGVLQKDGKLVVTGAMTGANGVVAMVKTVWQWNKETNVWDLVTGLPAKR